MVKSRMFFASTRGFAATVEDLKAVMHEISRDGRPDVPAGFPSSDTIRVWRAKNRDITLRGFENKDRSEVLSERYDHVHTLKLALQSVEAFNPRILGNSDNIWNIDEISVETTFGERYKTFGSSSTNHGGSVMTTESGAGGKHVTAVIAVSALGRIAPPFFIVAGKHVMSRWTDPFDEMLFRDPEGIPHRALYPNWFPGSGVVVCSEKGSMTKVILTIFMRHLARYARKFVTHDDPILLLLDGHKSRRGTEWLEVASQNNIEVVQMPANTSHFLQPCDQFVNKSFKSQVRKSRDYLTNLCAINAGDIQMKLILGIDGHHSISENDIRRSFHSTGIWPMDFWFMDRFKKDNGAGATGTLTSPSSRKRCSDKETYAAIRHILDKEADASSVIQSFTQVLASNDTVNSIIMSKISPRSILFKKEATGRKNVVLSGGLQAEYLTHADLLEKRKSLEESKAKLEAERKSAREERQRLKLKLNAGALFRKLHEIKRKHCAWQQTIRRARPLPASEIRQQCALRCYVQQPQMSEVGLLIYREATVRHNDMPWIR